MANVRFGGGVAEIRGSIGGTTFSRSRSGATARNRINPINPNTQPQADVRGLFSEVASRYAVLNGSQRSNWELFGTLVSPFKNKLGEDYTPSGRQMFQHCNMNLAATGASITNIGGHPKYVYDLANLVSSPNLGDTEQPSPPSFVGGDNQFTAIQSGGSLGTFESAVNFNAISGDDELAFILSDATPVYRESVRNVKGRFRFLGPSAAGAAAILNLLTEYDLVFLHQEVETNMMISIRNWTVNKTGLASDKVETLVQIGEL